MYVSMGSIKFKNRIIDNRGFKLSWERNPHLKRENGETHGIDMYCPELKLPLKTKLTPGNHLGYLFFSLLSLSAQM